MQSVRPKAGCFRRIFHSRACSRFTPRLARRIGFLDLAGQAAEHDHLSRNGSLLGRPELFPSQQQRVVTDFCPLHVIEIWIVESFLNLPVTSRWTVAGFAEWISHHTQRVFHVSRHFTSVRASSGKSRITNARVQQIFFGCSVERGAFFLVRLLPS